MIGPRYWCTGIVVHYDPSATAYAQGVERATPWRLEAQFFDDGWCADNSTEGTLRTRYCCADLAAALDTLIADLRRLGIELRSASGPPALYVQGDGEDEEVPLPANWREVIGAQCARLGWENLYAVDATGGGR